VLVIPLEEWQAGHGELMMKTTIEHDKDNNIHIVKMIIPGETISYEDMKLWMLTTFMPTVRDLLATLGGMTSRQEIEDHLQAIEEIARRMDDEIKILVSGLKQIAVDPFLSSDANASHAEETLIKAGFGSPWR